MKKLFVMMLVGFTLSAYGQHETQKYFPVEDPLVKEKLEQWQDIKFGLLMHWGPYSQWGIVESWSICSEDEPWCARPTDHYTEYKKKYEELPLTFNPTGFDPGKWAKAAADAGMKYVIFTTKHHDGFCMFDTQYTDYKITDPKTPFSNNSKANITLEIFKAFRAEVLWTGAYFSKPDWHSEYYWWPNFATPDRHVNYDVTRYPDRWENFVQYTHNQIMELMTDYGPVDILWLDGGWVQKMTQEEVDHYVHSPNYNFTRVQNQDIRMDELVAKARQKQPGLIVVDRAVEGPNQNYLTPENTVPQEQLSYPWESCIIMGGGWSYAFNARYKTSREVVHILIDIVSKGGNLLLNIAPSPDGQWDEGAYRTLEGVGEWMDLNAEAIYHTRKLAPYYEGPLHYTQAKDGSARYAIYSVKEGELLPNEILIKGVSDIRRPSVELLGFRGRIKAKQTDEGLLLEVPRKVKTSRESFLALVFRIK
ncbi:MAG: alpha-L-fucosidase [Bacteroidales bacterium]|nr:alpha-L-fucosidase [Bacteroidales bacterium]